MSDHLSTILSSTTKYVQDYTSSKISNSVIKLFAGSAEDGPQLIGRSTLVAGGDVYVRIAPIRGQSCMFGFNDTTIECITDNVNSFRNTERTVFDKW